MSAAEESSQAAGDRAATGEGCHGHTAQPGDIPAKVALPSLSPPSSAGIHKLISSADPAGKKDSLATVVESSYVSSALP